MRPLRGGQITIPAEFRKKLGITEDSMLRVTLKDRELRVRPVEVAEAQGPSWMAELYEYFAPVRAEAKGLSDEEINAAIDRAVAAVRAKHA